MRPGAQPRRPRWGSRAPARAVPRASPLTRPKDLRGRCIRRETRRTPSRRLRRFGCAAAWTCLAQFRNRMFRNAGYRRGMTLRGMATVNYFAADWAAARAFYTQVTGAEPYFLRDGYAEWRLGDHQAELGLIDARYRAPGTPTGPVGAVLYWHVDDVE